MNSVTSKRFTRKTQLFLLIGFTSLTLSPAYSLQGSLIHSAPNAVPVWLWGIETAMWALRALIEAWTISYLAQTHTTTRWQEALIWLLKITLIALIATTLGPVFAAIGQDMSIRESLTDSGYWWWTRGVAAYGPLMMLGAAVAYKIQPDESSYTQLVDEIEALRISLNESEQRANAAELAAKRSEAARIEAERQRTIAEQAANDTEAQRTASERRLKATERKLEEAEQRLNGIAELPNGAEDLFSNEVQERIIAWHQRRPELPNKWLAYVAEASPGYVSDVLKATNGVAK